MSRLLVFADIHGSLSGWLTIQALMKEGDGLAVAGDLFDTRYGSYSSDDFKPDAIKSDLARMDTPVYYVYGNCDVEGYYPGFSHGLDFEIFGKTCFIHHGHMPVPPDCDADIIIQGHTHLCELEQKNGRIFMNPGSFVRSRNSLTTYGCIDETGTSLVDLKTGRSIARLPF